MEKRGGRGVGARSLLQDGHLGLSPVCSGPSAKKRGLLSKLEACVDQSGLNSRADVKTPKGSFWV